MSWKLIVLLGSITLGAAVPCPAVAAEDGAKVFEEACSPCHSDKVRPLDKTHMTKEQWNETIDRMLDQGAEVPKGKRAVLLDYLTRTHEPAANPADSENK